MPATTTRAYLVIGFGLLLGPHSLGQHCAACGGGRWGLLHRQDPGMCPCSSAHSSPGWFSAQA